MHDGVTEKRYQSLRTKLTRLRYYQPLSLESTALAERLLNDLVVIVERSQVSKRHHEQRAEELRVCTTKLAALQFENPRLAAENNVLHAELIQVGETTQSLEAEARLRLRTLEDELLGVNLELKQAESNASKWERELSSLKTSAAALLRQAGVLRATATASGAARVVPPGKRKTDLRPEFDWQEQHGPLKQSGTTVVMNRCVADGLRAKVQALRDALQDCEAQTADLETEAYAETGRSAKLEEEAASVGRRLTTESVDFSTLYQKSKVARQRDLAEQVQAELERQTANHSKLEDQCALFKEECRHEDQTSSTLAAESRELRVAESRVAERVGQLLRGQQERSQLDEEHLRRGQERRSELQGLCLDLSTQVGVLEAELAKTLHAKDREDRAFDEEHKELLAKIRYEADRCALERADNRVQASQIASAVGIAQAAEAKTKENLQTLEAELQAAQAVAEENVQRLAGRVAEFDEAIEGGAHLQQQSKRSGAQVSWLSSSLQGLQSERQLLATHLEDVQSSLHRESLECVELRLQAQRFMAVVKSLDSTRNEWLSDIDRATTCLRRAHVMSRGAQQRSQAAERTRDRLQRTEEIAEEGVQAVSRERSELADEVAEWALELAEERDKREEVQAKASRLRGRLARREEECQRSIEARSFEAGISQKMIRRLRDELLMVESEEPALRRLRDEASVQLSSRIAESEESMLLMQGELEEILERHSEATAVASRIDSLQNREQARMRTMAEEVAEEEQRFREMDEACLTAQNKLSGVLATEDALEHEVALLRSDLACFEEEATAAVQTRASIERALEQRRARRDAVLGAKEVRTNELNAAKARLEKVGNRCDDLRADAEDLVALVANAEATRERLGAELIERKHDLKQERRETEQLESGKHGWAEEHQAAKNEVEAFRHAAAELDAERDDRQRIADIRAQEIVDMKHELASHQQALHELQEVLQNLRAATDSGAQRLEEQRRVSLNRERQVDVLTHRTTDLQAEAREQASEASGIFADLAHMTRENQTLHEESRVLERRLGELVCTAKSRLAGRENTEKHLRTIELDRDDIARHYHEVSQQTRQHALLVERLRVEAETSRGDALELETALIKGAQEETECRVNSESTFRDVSMMEGQLLELTNILARVEETQEEASLEDARLEGEVAATAEVCKGADEKEAARAHTISVLGLRRQQLQTAVKQARAEVSSNQRLANETREQLRRLEMLLEDQRERCRRGATENEALRQRVAGTQREKDAGSMLSATGRDTPGKHATISSGLPDSGQEAAALRKEIERRYAEVGELDAEQQSLSSEVAKMSALLRERQRGQACEFIPKRQR
eukprot:TRINITY_DN17174_c0_g1_i1.p1 TRINITY_DN17174_c0_g1~~TRINITY_DN17174_c0_g1_i1.p1  ORF type:complete len:1330 (-),score=328.08 TRINITY_DN17174_c0_g1_i1:99-4088(-)